MGNVAEVLEGRGLDYVILNHMEQDHSGSLPQVLKVYPNATVIGTPMTVSMVKSFYGTAKCMTSKDGDLIDLGDRTLKFITLLGFTGLKPWSHTC